MPSARRARTRAQTEAGAPGVRRARRLAPGQRLLNRRSHERFLGLAASLGVGTLQIGSGLQVAGWLGEVEAIKELVAEKGLDPHFSFLPFTPRGPM